jgi:hypothetical protein
LAESSVQVVFKNLHSARLKPFTSNPDTKNSVSIIMNQIITLVTSHKNKIESALALLVILSSLAKVFHLPFADEMTMITMSSLAMYYFLSAYLPSPIANLYAIIAWKVIGIGCSVCIIGMLFGFLHMPGAANMLVIGVPTIFIAGASYLIFALRQWTDQFYYLFGRIIFLGIVAANMAMSLVR